MKKEYEMKLDKMKAEVRRRKGDCMLTIGITAVSVLIVFAMGILLWYRISEINKLDVMVIPILCEVLAFLVTLLVNLLKKRKSQIKCIIIASTIVIITISIAARPIDAICFLVIFFGFFGVQLYGTYRIRKDYNSYQRLLSKIHNEIYIYCLSNFIETE